MHYSLPATEALLDFNARVPGNSGGMTSGAPPRDRDDFRGGGGGGGGGGGAFGRSAPPPVPSNFRAKGSAYRAMVKNLPMSASWQDLKVTRPSLSVSTPNRDTYPTPIMPLPPCFFTSKGCTPYY